jgi:hypothetical protein
MYRRTLLMLGAALLLALALAVPAMASSDHSALLGHHLWLNGERLGTLVVSSPLPPGGGTDPIYAIFVDGQMFGDGIAAVGPGSGSYHGGAWAVHVVTFTAGNMPYQFTSADEVLAAQAAGIVTITRVAEADFRCPVLPYSK